MVTVLFQTESHFPVDRSCVRSAVVQALGKKISGRAEVSISVVGDRLMRELNKKYRNLNETTDVLSFPLNDPTDSGVPFANPPDNILRLGDIVVSYPMAVLTAGEQNRLVDDVVVDLVLHGLNHLMGIHHD